PRKKRARAVTREQRLEERPLEGRGPAPDNFGDLLCIARLPNQRFERTSANSVEVLDIELVEDAARPERPPVDVARAADMFVVGRSNKIEVLRVDVVEPTTVVGEPALRHECAEEGGE